MKLEKIVGVLFLTVTTLVGMAATEVDPQWGAADGNCQTKAETIVTQKDTKQEFELVREWKENANGYHWELDPERGLVPDYPIGGWLDGGTTSVSNYYAVYWLKFTLEKGKDYVFSVPEGNGCTYTFSKATNSTYLAFGKQSALSAGVRHYYVRSTDWVYQEASSVDYYLRISGGLNIQGDKIGKVVPVMFQQRSIRDLLTDEPGSDKLPYDLDVAKSGRETIKTPIKDLDGKYYTAYRVNLKAGDEYVFYGEYDAVANQAVSFALTEGSSASSIPGTISIGPDAERSCFKMTITVTKDYEFVFRARGYVYTKSVEGMSFEWTVNGAPVPGPEPTEPDSCGVYSGTLLDEETGLVQMSFALCAKLYSDGTTNICGSAVAGSTAIAFGQEVAGVITGQTVIAGTPYQSVFAVELLSGTILHVDGEVYLEDGTAKRYFFAGDLLGSQVDWSESLVKYDASTQSAADMGITAEAFRDEPAGSAELQKLIAWGATQNVGKSIVNSMLFSTAGDPENLVAKAYLLDCAFADEAVAVAEAMFVITGFDVAGGITVAGSYQAGDAYGNGTVEARTSVDPAGTYDKTDKGDVPRLFYKAYLVK